MLSVYLLTLRNDDFIMLLCQLDRCDNYFLPLVFQILAAVCAAAAGVLLYRAF